MKKRLLVCESADILVVVQRAEMLLWNVYDDHNEYDNDHYHGDDHNHDDYDDDILFVVK